MVPESRPDLKLTYEDLQAFPDDETVKVYRQGAKGFERVAELSKEAGDALTTPLLPGFAARLEKVFE